MYPSSVGFLSGTRLFRDSAALLDERPPTLLRPVPPKVHDVFCEDPMMCADSFAEETFGDRRQSGAGAGSVAARVKGTKSLSRKSSSSSEGVASLGSDLASSSCLEVEAYGTSGNDQMS